MAFAFAGQWGPEPVADRFGNAVYSATFRVLTTSGAEATVYTDRTKATTASQPLDVDGEGNATFYAAPGRYTIELSAGGSVTAFPVGVVPDAEDVHPKADVHSKADADAAYAAVGQTTLNMQRYLPSGFVDGADITTEVQTAVDAAIAQRGKLVFPRGLEFAMGQVAVANGAHFDLVSEGAKITLAGADAQFRLEGTLDEVAIRGFEMVGDGTVLSNHRAVSCASTAVIDGATIEGIVGSDLRIGITVNGEQGSLRRVRIAHNDLRRIVGTDAGEGYGIHVACGMADLGPAGIEIMHNTLRDCGRHSIYWARGYGGEIAHNDIFDHRSTVGVSGAVRSAIQMARGGKVKAHNNLVDDYFGSALSAIHGSDNDVNGGWEIYRNTFLTPKEALPVIFLGDSVDPGGDAFLDVIDVTDNLFLFDGGAFNVNLIQYGLGRQLTVVENRAFITNAGSATTFLMVAAFGEAGQALNIDHVRVAGNTMRSDAGRFVRFNAAAGCTNLGVYDFENNHLDGVTPFTQSQNLDGPTIRVSGQPSSGTAWASGKGFAAQQLDGPISTTATAGAETLPANPVGFLTMNIGGTDRKVPYYDA